MKRENCNIFAYRAQLLFINKIVQTVHNNSTCVLVTIKKPELKKYLKLKITRKMPSCHNTKVNCETWQKNNRNDRVQSLGNNSFELKGAHLKLIVILSYNSNSFKD
jgi:hypothetical protein